MCVGGEGAGTGGRKRKGRDKEEHKGLKDGGSMDRLVFFQVGMWDSTFTETDFENGRDGSINREWQSMIVSYPYSGTGDRLLLQLIAPSFPPPSVVQLAGRLLGLSVRHGTPLGVVLPPAVWGLLQGRTPTWQDYCGDDHTFKASMQKVGQSTGGREGHGH